MSDFGWVDYTVVGGTLLFSLFIGIYYAFGSRNKTQEDMLVGGRRLVMVHVTLNARLS